MATYQTGDRYSAAAAADFTGKRYTIVKTDSNGDIVNASAATDAILGVIDNEPTLGRTADVVTVNSDGTFKVKAGGVISKDAYLTSDSNGAAVATTTTGNRVFGRALTSAVSGQIVEYLKLSEKY